MEGRFLCITAVTLVVVGCGDRGNRGDGKDDTGAGTSPDEIEQSAECEDYLDCVLAVSPDAVGGLMDSYGPDGSCWESQEAAELCTEACVEATTEWGEQFPLEDACRPDGEQGSQAFLGTESTWSWDSVSDCDGAGAYLEYSFYAVLMGSDSDAFELWFADPDSMEPTGSPRSCALSGFEFTCESSEWSCEGEPCTQEFSGTFFNDFMGGTGNFQLLWSSSTYLDCDLLGERLD